MTTFKMGETEVTYELWNAVKTWALSNGYTFANAGRQGGDSGTGPVGTDQHPVTSINWRDAVVWCNAYSEAKGLTPAYTYSGNVIKDSTNSTACESAAMDVTNGYRLPTEAEWEYAARGGVPSTSIPWTYTYAGSNTIGDVAVYPDGSASSTASVKSKMGGSYGGANSAGLYDMSGNVSEWCQDIDSSVNRVNKGGHWSGMSGDTNTSQVSRHIGASASPTYVSSSAGFRVVCP